MKARKNMTNKSKMLRNKRAVSPLIATVLLIAFAVALGAVVMNWGRGYVEDTANTARERGDAEVKCASDVDIAFVDIDGTPQVCYNTSSYTGDGGNVSIDFIIENRKSTTVWELQARMFASDTRVPYSLSMGQRSNLTGNQAKLLNVSFEEADWGEPIELRLTPVIRVAGKDVICTQNSETATQIKPCSEVFT